MIVVDYLAVWGGSYRGEQAAQAARVGARNGNRWSHLTSTPDDDPDFAKLHEFAARIGMKRSWFQGDHYDLTPSKRAMAVRLGAVEVERLEVSMILLYDRKGRERPEWGDTSRTVGQEREGEGRDE